MDRLSALLEKSNADVPIKLLNYPDVRQSTKDRCGIDAVQTVLQYYGEDYREDELLSSLRNKNTYLSDNMESARVNNVVNLFKEKEYKIDFKQMNINDIISYLNRDIPVILLIQAWGDVDDYEEEWKSGHYVVAVGYTKNKILFEDPATFQMTYLPFDELMVRWHDEDEERRYINFGMAIYGKQPKFDKNKWLKIG